MRGFLNQMDDRMEIKFPYKLINNFQGYVFFSEMHAQTKSCYEDLIVLNFADTKVIESNLFAILGSLIAGIERRKNKIRLANVQEPIQNLFNTTRLIRGSARKYLWKSFVKCQQFSSDDEEILSDYLTKKIFPERPEVRINSQIKMAIQLCVAEVFRNAFTHSNSKEVFIAHYYSVYNKKLLISVVSQGRPFHLLVNKNLSKSLNGVGGIEWAVEDGNTTQAETHKGIGLYTICQFIKQNKGKIQIVSGNGIWKQVKHRTFSKLYETEFPGSVLTLEFNLENE
jgi:ABC-type transporter Mla MlaB component